MKFSLASARENVEKRDYNNGLLHYLVVLKSVAPTVRQKYHQEFTICLKAYVENLKNIDNISEPVLALYPQSSEVHFLIASYKYLRGNLHGALSIIRTVLEKLRPTELEKAAARVYESNLRSNLFPGWHMVMINDTKRNLAYAEAINRLVTENDTVIDVGSGSGLLSILAAKKSAKVIGIEGNNYLYEVSKNIVKTNMGEENKKITLINMNSQKFIPEDDQKATLIVSEIMDCCAFGEGLIGTFYDAHQRLVQPNCRFIPSSVELYITLYESHDIYKMHYYSEYRSPYTYPKVDKEDEPYWCHYLSHSTDARPLSKPIPVVGVNLESIDDLARYMAGVESKVTIEANDSGVANIVVAYFRAVLCEDVILETKDETFWEQGIYLLSSPIDVVKGMQVSLSWSLQNNRMSIWNSETKFAEHSGTEVIEQDTIELMNDVELAQEIITYLPGRFSKVVYTPAEMPFALPFLESGSYSETYHPVVKDLSILYKSKNGRIDSGSACDMLVAWPVRADGSLNDKLLERIANAITGEILRPSLIFPEKICCRGYLLSSPSLAKRCRPDSSAHLGVDLSDLESWNLFEYRDIKLDSFPHTIHSEESSLFDFDFLPFLQNEPETVTTVVEIVSMSNVEVDGIAYWFTAGNYSSRSRKVATFVFNKPFIVPEDGIVPLRVDIYKYQMMLSVDELKMSK